MQFTANKMDEYASSGTYYFDSARTMLEEFTKRRANLSLMANIMSAWHSAYVGNQKVAVIHCSTSCNGGHQRTCESTIIGPNFKI